MKFLEQLKEFCKFYNPLGYNPFGHVLKIDAEPEVHYDIEGFPSPEELAAYEKVLPGAADRILSLFEKEYEIKMIKKALNYE